MPELIKLTAKVPPNLALKRLDSAAAALFPDYSRVRLQRWIDRGELLVDGQNKAAKSKVSAGMVISIAAMPDVLVDTAEDIALDVVFEDEHLLVINKPAGLVVHPGAGNRSGTLLNALLHYAPGIETVPRAGIVHRLDKDTTGLMVVAKTIKAQLRLVEQLSMRTVKRQYDAVVYGQLGRGGTVDAAIGRHPHQRTRMAIQASGKPAVTHYSVKTRFAHHTHVELSLETGRTHQIRVHMQKLGFPLVGDPTYGGHFRIPKGGCSDALLEVLRHFPRQALHARILSFQHPESNETVQFESTLPADMVELLATIKSEG